MLRENSPFIPLALVKEVRTAERIKELADEVERLQDFAMFVMESKPSDFDEIVAKAVQIVEDLGR